MSAPIYLRDLFPNPYEKLGPNFKQLKVAGQICITPILYCYENTQIWRPCQTDATGTQASRFEIVSAGHDAYDRALPLKSPPLSIKEEFSVVRAKRRPVIIIRVAKSGQGQITGIAGSASRPLPMVLPLYSVEDLVGRQKYPSDFLARVQQLEYPEYFFLPADGAAIQKDSLLPLFRMAHAFDGHLEPCQWKLTDEVLRILVGQVGFWLAGVYGGDYATAREMLLNPGQQKV